MFRGTFVRITPTAPFHSPALPSISRAASVAISHRTAPIGWDTWPKEIVEVPLLQKVESDIGKGFGAQARGGTATLLG